MENKFSYGWFIDILQSTSLKSYCFIIPDADYLNVLKDWNIAFYHVEQFLDEHELIEQMSIQKDKPYVMTYELFHNLSFDSTDTLDSQQYVIFYLK